jgi:hypothetical protein
MYLFVDSTRETMHQKIELLVGLTCLPRWYETLSSDTPISGLQEKTSRGASTSLERPTADITSGKDRGIGQRPKDGLENRSGLFTVVSQKEIVPQMGSLIAEIYSWKSLALGQPILRLHTAATKAALITLAPG